MLFKVKKHSIPRLASDSLYFLSEIWKSTRAKFGPLRRLEWRILIYIIMFHSTIAKRLNWAGMLSLEKFSELRCFISPKLLAYSLALSMICIEYRYVKTRVQSTNCNKA